MLTSHDPLIRAWFDAPGRKAANSTTIVINAQGAVGSYAYGVLDMVAIESFPGLLWSERLCFGG